MYELLSTDEDDLEDDEDENEPLAVIVKKQLAIKEKIDFYKHCKIKVIRVNY